MVELTTKTQPLPPVSAVNTPKPQPDLLTTQEAADWLRLAPGTLANWRCLRIAGTPQFVRLGRAIRYRRSELERYITARHVDPTPQKLGVR